MSQTPNELTHNLICLTVDVEWANPEVLADLVGLFNERQLRATFFCTHANISVPDHERALHPNFRRNGDVFRQFQQQAEADLEQYSEVDIYQYVIQTTHTFCPEAIGVRAHSLFYDSQLLPLYHEAGLRYDSSYLLPLVSGLRPVWKEYDLLELPIYYNDHFDLKAQATHFNLENLKLDQPGLKVFNFHPNMVFINAATNAHYLDCKPFYHDYEALLKRRYPGQGIRTLLLELLDFIEAKQLPTATLADLDTAWREAQQLRHNDE